MRMRLAPLFAGVVLVAAGCGSGAGGDTASGEMPSEIKVFSVTDKTGTLSYAGTNQLKGIELAIEEINEQNYLGESTMVLESRDSAGEAQTAASQVTEATVDPRVAAILGTVTSAQTVAVAPLAQAAKVPIVFTQSGSDGTLVGEYTYRATAPMATYYDQAGEYLQTQNVKSLGILYNSANPTLAQLSEGTIPDMGGRYGFTVASTSAVQNTTQDFTAPIAKLLADDPDGIAIMMNGAQNATAVSQLRQAGFDGTLVTHTGSGAGNLTPAGPAGAGMTWPTDFTYHGTNPATQDFVEAYRTKYDGENPNNYAAEGYDAAWMIARAIEKSGGASREDIQNGLQQVVAEGFTGAEGDVTFEGNDMSVKGALVQWNGTEEVLLSEK
ncbi:ABC transporter substrate-binding protein [Rhodococcus sp. BP-252]|uniref:ABC transporter substrate-binding protein n=1 Tax=unclassified Rhodococcus (in: high G+C Gram-positive bacteria) TaxID=192944 RepID=UPI001C9B7835|nr:MULTISPECIES: ABC transporter substrate-binding protein [unclassified Rhodococcus (in: high G+C Gram-positive bacteria)]MBY6412597.1 ABC transporter substrate-binding protein [Rhodococcus sp. BP-320]MBY6417148.1 ABC transporter substrate-binding protein [Rhodococcus sp. BP-321]MBY6423236.1 ABC transporter substrate-binding protein [Rhodococcus sp. BP-324]MBY6427172.1 ABC transporter substrate-binding protein [Rhodococcus sp. BP-323]MBY6432215.1 ABC transporter substrate-binding protein [Rho